ncbi:MAG: PRC-barrel domain-containing protein [Desulfotomaculaceae bacterium]|nr:PRC-barrel domain-containing protein [Desulfotomaculaceae bacterium]
MKKSKQLLSLAVISLEEGQQIGTVKGLIIDPAGKKLAALIIEQKGWFKEQRFITYNKVHSVGSDAITIEKSSCVEKGGTLSEIVKLLKDKISITGSKIVAENGTVLGYVDEYYIDLTTGGIAGLEFSGNLIDSVIKGRAFLDTSYIRTFGKEVTIVTDEGIDNIFKQEGGLQEKVKSIKESTGQIWDNTFKKTKELGNSINKKVKGDKKTRSNPSENMDESAFPLETPAENLPVDEISQKEDQSGDRLNEKIASLEKEAPDNIATPTGGSSIKRKDDTSL